MRGINNTGIIEKKREYGEITEWEARHRCIADVWTTITKEDIKKAIPVMCMVCGKDIVIYDDKDSGVNLK